MYEVGVRVPLLVSAGAFGDPGASLHRWREPSTVTHLDWLPTLVNLATRAMGPARDVPAPRLPCLGGGVDVSELLLRPPKPPAGGVTEVLAARATLLEVGVARALQRGGWKVVWMASPKGEASAPMCPLRAATCGASAGHAASVRAAGPWAVDRNGSACLSACINAQGHGLDAFIANGMRGKQPSLTFDGLIRHPGSYCDRIQLYDLARDPAEQCNVATQHPALTLSMVGEMATALHGVGEHEHAISQSAAQAKEALKPFLRGADGDGRDEASRIRAYHEPVSPGGSTRAPVLGAQAAVAPAAVEPKSCLAAVSGGWDNVTAMGPPYSFGEESAQRAQIALSIRDRVRLKGCHEDQTWRWTWKSTDPECVLSRRPVRGRAGPPRAAHR